MAKFKSFCVYLADATGVIRDERKRADRCFSTQAGAERFIERERAKRAARSGYAGGAAIIKRAPDGSTEGRKVWNFRGEIMKKTGLKGAGLYSAGPRDTKRCKYGTVTQGPRKGKCRKTSSRRRRGLGGIERPCPPGKKRWGGVCVCKYGRVKVGKRKGQCRKTDR